MQDGPESPESLSLKDLSDCHGGSLAAKFQGLWYGAATPAGGLFAKLTSLGMRGLFSQIRTAGIATLEVNISFYSVQVSRQHEHPYGWHHGHGLGPPLFTVIS